MSRLTHTKAHTGRSMLNTAKQISKLYVNSQPKRPNIGLPVPKNITGN